MRKTLFTLTILFSFKLYSQEIIEFKKDEFEFYLSKDCQESQCKISEIKVFKNDKFIQKIIPSENEFFSSSKKESIMEIEDMNFDNHIDFRIGKSRLMDENGGFPFLYWIFNPSNGIFEKKSSFEKITSPEFDYKKEEIISKCFGYLNTKNIYKYKLRNEKPILIEKYLEMYVKQGVKKSEYWKLINNEFKLIESKIIE
ncbi:XAC2610-related protein [Psychroserpens damuponensis]|uniref:XAC2610-related protein n=1 Tax=Psychroserpens damuponensis TaxID=943936 RepID=UPI000590088E|nr:hypothetical protein [Psychroserpens damuponensis]